MQPEKEEEQTVRRGPKLRGEIPRKRFNVSLDPSVVDQAKDHADMRGETLSGMIERLLKKELAD